VVSSASVERWNRSMGKKLTLALALVALALGGLLPIGSAVAQLLQAPIGHRQPTVADVPSNDSVRGDPNLSGGDPNLADQPQPSTKRGRRNKDKKTAGGTRIDEGMMKTPNICWNCND
jgi:hypothetical protein